MENWEYAQFIIFPVILGYVGERYKDMSTIKYGMLILLMLFCSKAGLVLTYGRSLINDVSEALIIFSVFFGCTAFFHLQKVLRRQKNIDSSR